MAQPESPAPLVERSVRDFVAAVASTRQSVPAGGSVAALSGASSAALLALVCGVLARKDVGGLSAALGRAEALQQQLLDLVDADARAFRAFVRDRHSQAAAEQLNGVPMHIARACAEVVDLSREIEERASGPMLGDVRAARHIATAGLAAALDIADQDVPLLSDPATRQRQQADIAALRRSR